MRTFVIGNIQGHYRELMQCLTISRFDYNEDRLMVLGNVTGFGPHTVECVEELLKIKKKRVLAAGHDEWFKVWLGGEDHPDGWMTGGTMTLTSYLSYTGKSIRLTKHGSKLLHMLRPEDIPEDHWMFYLKRTVIYQDSEKRVYVSAGLDPEKSVMENFHLKSLLYWDKTLWHQAFFQRKDIKLHDSMKEVYIADYGVKETAGLDIPLRVGNIWNVGTSFRNAGRLTMLDVETKEYYQSELIEKIYT